MAANDFAIIIGIDKYDEPNNDLNNAVRGALRVYEWLTTKAAVPKDNIILLLSPKPGDLSAAGLEVSAATSQKINWAIQDELPLRSNQYVGDRFYFYYSGHGFTQRGTISTEDAIIQSDYIHGRNPPPFSVESLKAFFRGTSFATQIFVFDSCRDKNKVIGLQTFTPAAGDDIPRPTTGRSSSTRRRSSWSRTISPGRTPTSCSTG